jgi:quinoprotein glucose dehydrogenase
MRSTLFALLLLAAACRTTTPSTDDWPAYANAGGTRYSPLTAIDRTNVSRLQVAWTYHTGETSFAKDSEKKSTFEATPIVVDGTLYISTGFNKVIALDAATGRERWTYDPRVDRSGDFSEVTSRGVSYWGKGKRIFEGTIDARLIALDAATGEPVKEFGARGTVDLTEGIDHPRFGDYQVTSPPAVIGDLVVIGSAIGDNSAAELERGVVRAYDARTGALRWSFDPIAHETHSGAANAWAPITADPESGMVFIPTSSPSPDYYGGLRLGRNELANSIVAIRASSGEVVWHFQVVHHDLWDYDIATQPVLVEVRGIKAVAIGTKMGHLYFFDRLTGKPLFPIEERAVPASDVAGEEASPTQPFPTAPPPIVPEQLKADDAFGVDDADRTACRNILASLRNDGMFTPPSVRGTLQMPGNVGGMNWGGMSYDPVRHILIASTNRLAAMVRLIRRRLRSRSREKQRRADLRRVQRHARDAVRDVPHDHRVAQRRSLHTSAMGRADGGRCRSRSRAMGDAVWRHPATRRPRSQHRLPQPRRVDDVGRRRLHRRGDGRSISRLRRRDRQGVVARAASGKRAGVADDVSRQRQAVRRHRRRRSRQAAHEARR